MQVYAPDDEYEGYKQEKFDDTNLPNQDMIKVNEAIEVKFGQMNFRDNDANQSIVSEALSEA